MSKLYSKQYIPTFEEYADEDKRGRQYMMDTIRKAMGNPAEYSGSADWGGIPVWPLTGDKFVGKFLILDDNDDAVILERTLTGEAQDEYTDTDIEQGDHHNVETIIQIAKTIKAHAHPEM
jgi:cation transport regulator ChaB